MAGGRSLAQRAREGVRKGRRTMLSEINPTDSITAQDVINSARRGDLFSQQLITESGYHLGTAIAGLVNLINPEIIVIGGGVAQLGDLLLDPIRKTVKERSLLVSWQAVPGIIDEFTPHGRKNLMEGR